MQNQIFPSKILLFGEYVVLLHAKALVMPFPYFLASLQFIDNKNIINIKDAKFSNHVLHNFYEYISKSLDKTNLADKFDLKKFHSDVMRGLYVNSNIPMGYGVGSSGAITAAVYDNYCIGRDNGNVDGQYLLQVKKDLAYLESFFHVNSSGIDPLVCYYNKTALYEENKIKLSNFSLLQAQYFQVFLIDAGIPRKTGNLVEQFINNCMDETYLSSIRNNIMLPSNNCIDALLEGNKAKFFRNLSDLSTSQFNYFRPMIVPSLQAFWNQSFQSDHYVLKLCGSGGGGYLLAFVKNYDGFTSDLKQFNLSALLASSLS